MSKKFRKLMKAYVEGYEDLLLFSGVLSISEMKGAKKGKTQMLQLLSPTQQIIKAAWKYPLNRVMRKGNVSKLSSPFRERAVFLVSEILGLGIVPPVVIRRIDGRLGSAMAYIEADTWKNSQYRYEDIVKREWQKLAILDWVVCSLDRHRRNWLVTDTGEFWAIDNDLSFPEKGEYGSFFGYRSKPHYYLTQAGDLELLDDLCRLFTEEKKVYILSELLKLGLPILAIQIFSDRWDYIVEHKVLPEYDADDSGFMKGEKL